MLNSRGYRAYRRRKVIYLTPEQKRKRKIWAKFMGGWTQRMWNKVVFSDESKFNVFGSDSRLKVWRKKGEGEYKETNTYKTVQDKGENIIVQKYITSKGFGKLYRIQGKIDKDKYISILSECLLGTLSDQQLYPKSIIFQQDNDPKHIAKATKAQLISQGIPLLIQLAKTVDMNIIEHVQDYFERRVRKREIQP